jgi:hypothetical protein
VVSQKNLATGHLRTLEPVYEAILNLSDAKLRQASTNNENIAVRERFTSKNEAVLFIANYYNEEQSGKVTYTHPESGEEITIPYTTQQEIIFPSIYGILTPICMQVSAGIKILHSTSDILNIDNADGQLQITLYGDRDLIGEIVFEGPEIKKINSVTLDGESVRKIRDEKRIAFIYSHKHRSEMILTIKLS